MPPDFFTKSKVKFYLWVGLAYCLLNIVGGILFYYPDQPFAIVFNNVWLNIYTVVVNYILFEFTLSFFSLRKIHWFLLLLVFHLLMYPFLFFEWRALGLYINVYTELNEMTYFKRLESMMSYAVGSMVIFGISRHVYTFINLKRTALQLLIEKQEAELNYLKSQTNPHFLFNTLNNIYSLSRDKSDLAPESIMRLSKILRYMLYETGGHSVSIEQELQIINNYIELERLRYDDSLKITFVHSIDDKGQAISPLLLMPLIENAFKHGASETIVQPFVSIQLLVEKQQLHLKVENSADDTEGELKENIGLTNLRRQLNLLYKESSLEVQHVATSFVASLKINLASHV